MYRVIKKQKCNLKSGFTLVELLITISMFVIVTGVVLVNSKSFDSSVLLNNFAYDVALTIKQAQSYGVNVRETSSGTFNTGVAGKTTAPAYGVFFDLSQSKTTFVLFNDAPDSNGSYDRIYNKEITVCSVDDPECIQKYTIRKGNYIKELCAGNGKDSFGNYNCEPVNQLSILFQRPNLAALIYSGSTLNNYAKITLASESGAEQAFVVVTSVGQIYVKK